MKTLIACRFALGLVIALVPHLLRAGLPEPDNVFFGTISLDGRTLTAEDSDVVVEARRTPTGLPVSIYRLGSISRFGSFYSLRVTLESGAPKSHSSVSLVGETLYIVVTDSNGDRETRQVTVGPRGTIVRLDIGTTSSDSDNDGLPDLWELTHFGNLSRGPNSVGPNGDTVLYSYITGTDPNNPNDRFQLSIEQSGLNKTVRFRARRASGDGYAGATRVFGLEYSTNLATGPWLGVPSYTNIVGDDSIVSYSARELDLGTGVHFRGRVRLDRQ